MDGKISKAELGLMYMKGCLAVGKYDPDAIKWCQQAAEGRFAQAEYVLGFLYHKGLGVSKDPKKAFHWFNRAAFQGVSGAQYAVGVMYDSGRGVKLDCEQAHLWFTRAAKHGNTEAIAALHHPTEPRLARREADLAEACIEPQCKYCGNRTVKGGAILGRLIICKKCLWKLCE